MGWFAWSRRQLEEVAPEEAALDLNTLPDDVSGLNALDVWHYAICHAFGSHASVPLAPTANILDVACGTGRWAREMAREVPGGWVAGFDLDGPQIDRALEADAWRGDELLPPTATLLRPMRWLGSRMLTPPLITCTADSFRRLCQAIAGQE